MKNDAPNFQNGVPEMVVLRLLAAREMYGYELVKETQRTSQGILTYGEGCVYPILHYLEAARLVTRREEEVGGRSRTYYRLTPQGHKRLAELKAQWDRVVQGVQLTWGEQYA